MLNNQIPTIPHVLCIGKSLFPIQEICLKHSTSKTDPMKKIYALIIACVLTLGSLHAQKQYDCYRLQEFMFNTQTQAYDTPVEKADFSKFVFDEEKMTLTQQYQDGTSSAVPIKTADKSGLRYDVISPANGYLYVYRIKPNDNVIEVVLVQNKKETLLKKYLYKA